MLQEDVPLVPISEPLQTPHSMRDDDMHSMCSSATLSDITLTPMKRPR